MQKVILAVFLSIFLSSLNFAQAPKKPTSGEIYQSIQKLNFLGTVLYVAAHPDDENTNLISYFANDVKARTAYLSLTRGDGGQNEVGPDIREFLGLIRTQELLAARRTDGGEQFFTRANDFGYSKHPDETLEIWNKEEVLKDVVATIRKFKPDVIINRFNHRTPGASHGHHTSSAMLSMEAFDLAADKSYKTHLEADNLWQPLRLYYNISWWSYGGRDKFAQADKTNFVAMDIGSYYSGLGLSNSEIASLSRSKHQSQGFGSSGSRGVDMEYLEFLKGKASKNGDVFEGIDTSWNRVKGGKAIGVLVKDIIKNYSFRDPPASIPDLLRAYGLIEQLEPSHWKQIKIKEIKEIIAACSGLFLEVTANDASTTANSKNELRIEAINRSDANIKLNKVRILPLNIIDEKALALEFNKSNRFKMEVNIPEDIAETSPYWLREKGTLGMYKASDDSYIGMPETPRSVWAEFDLEVEGVTLSLSREVVYKYTSPVKGEVYKPFEILPQVTANFNEKVVIFAGDKAQNISLKVKAGASNLNGEISMSYPKGWEVSPKKYEFNLDQKGEEQNFDFQLKPPAKQSEGLIRPRVTVSGKTYDHELVEMDYDHIPFQSIIRPSEAKVVRLNIKRKGNNIGYIQGAGDVVPTSLRQIGYTVTELSEGQITAANLTKFDAVILGVRVYNVSDRAKYYQKELHQYVAEGGTLIVQYNKSFGLKVSEVSPLPLTLSRDRVADENAVVTITNPDHSLLNFPNKIEAGDFEGWVQERGLYFPNKWDEQFETLIKLNDKNETPKEGSLLTAKYGKGHFIYTGLSFFRELPAGVSGAYKLFANMISIGEEGTDKTVKK